MPRYYPMMLDLNGRRCVVVGGGEVAARKAEMLASCGATVAVVAPDIHPLLEPLIAAGKVQPERRPYRAGDLNGASLAIASTDSEAVNRAVFADAQKAGMPVNVVDVPELCSFIVPSVVERGDLVIAISTSGKSPAMAKRIRRDLEERFGPEYEAMLALMGEVRQLVQKREADVGKRMAILSGIANSGILDRLKAGDRPTAEEVLKEAMAR